MLCLVGSDPWKTAFPTYLREKSGNPSRQVIEGWEWLSLTTPTYLTGRAQTRRQNQE